MQYIHTYVYYTISTSQAEGAERELTIVSDCSSSSPAFFLALSRLLMWFSLNFRISLVDCMRPTRHAQVSGLHEANTTCTG